MARDGSEIGDDSPPRRVGTNRVKRGKELRDLLKIFGGLVVAEGRQADRQDGRDSSRTAPGDFQVPRVQSELLRDMRDELAAEPAGPAALIAVGFVHPGAGRCLSRQPRDHFAGRFASLRRR